jgi:RimJ/RimL family protein N-acetyltransferase
MKMVDLFPTPHGNITIRLATPEDAASLLDLRLESLSNHPEAFAADIDMTVADGVEAFVKLITENANSHSGAVCVACAGAELIGMAGITRGHWPKTRHFGTLWGVYLRPAWRGCHIGGAIVKAISEWAREDDLTVIYLGVTINDHSAIRCYQHCGFTEYGVEPKAIFYKGIYYDQLLMVKLL